MLFVLIHLYLDGTSFIGKAPDNVNEIYSCAFDGILEKG